MAAAPKRKRRKAASKRQLHPDIPRLRDARGRGLPNYLIDGALAVGAALGLLVALFTGSSAPGAVSHRGPLRFAMP